MDERKPIDPELRDVIKAAMSAADEAQRRLWRVRDRISQLSRDLSLAETELAVAERDDTAARNMVAETWDYWRSQTEPREVSQ